MKTLLHQWHCEHHARMGMFAGYEMPLFFKGALEEHRCVREDVGIFDVSHMGVISIKGQESEPSLDYLFTNSLLERKEGSATYGILCNEQGKCIEDLIFFKEDSNNWFLICNAANKENVYKHLTSNLPKKLEVKVEGLSVIAIQGPHSHRLVKQALSLENIPHFMHFTKVDYKGEQVVVSSSGYTGSLGIELVVPNELILDLWEHFFSFSSSYSLQAVGLVARDSLRLEAGFALYGNELSPELYPFETVSAWSVRMRERSFLGKEAIIAAKQKPHKLSIGMKLKGKKIPRKGYEVFSQNDKVGVITSGGFSPCLDQPIAIGLFSKAMKPGEEVQVQIRNQMEIATLCQLPFIRKDKG